MIAIDIHRKRIHFSDKLAPKAAYGLAKKLWKNNDFLICWPFPVRWVGEGVNTRFVTDGNLWKTNIGDL